MDLDTSDPSLPIDVQPQPNIPTVQPTTQDMANFNQNIRNQESRLRNSLTSIMNSPYMPTRDQTIQLVTTVLTLALMMTLGPMAGSNASLIQSIIKQIVPFIVAASVHYAADQTSPLKPIDAPITNVQLQPVQVPQSTLSQTI